MKARLVRDVMTKDVITVRTYTSFRLVASAMLGHDVGAVPVVDALGHPLGTVWERISARGRRTAEAAHASTAAWLMSHRAVTVTPDDTVFRAAYLMRRHDVSHLPVVDRRGVVIGIVARGDLLGEFMREDKLIREDVVSEVLAHRIDDPDAVEVAVERGVVTLEGQVRFASDALYAIERTRTLPGVIDVVDLLRWGTDDRKPQVGAL